MNKHDEELELHLKARPTETVSINIPTDTLESLKKFANNRDMTLDALLNFSIGQSLRQDVAKYGILTSLRDATRTTALSTRDSVTPVGIARFFRWFPGLELTH